MYAKLTHKDFIKRISALLDGFQVVGEYIDRHTKIKFIHNICDSEINKSPKAIYQDGLYCTKCRKENRIKENQDTKKTRKRSISKERKSINTEYYKNKFIKKVHEKYGDLFMILEYDGSKKLTTLKHMENNCMHTFKIYPSHLLSKNIVCPECKKQLIQEKYKKKVYDLVGDEFSVESQYINPKTKVLYRHKECNKTFLKYPYEINYRELNCPHCRVHHSKVKDSETFYDFEKIVFEKFGDEYLILDEYINNQTRLRIKHNTEDCGNLFTRRPADFLHSNALCDCVGYKSKMEINKNKFIQKINNVFGDDYILTGEYSHHQKHTVVKHSVCGREFKTTPSMLFKFKYPCPFCFQSKSKGEHIIYKFLSLNNVEFDKQFRIKECKDKKRLPFDFVVFKENQIYMLIEFDGEQHFKPVEKFGGEEEFKKTQKRDQIKNNFCIENNIPLLRIPFWEIQNAETILQHYLIESVDNFNGSFLVSN